jgi:hypothetical protein
MTKKQRLLQFINDEDLFNQVERVIDVAKNASNKAEGRLFKNAIDPFSALFDSMIQGVTLEQWLEQEKARQAQKTLQNALGNFHQEILGSISGWESLGTGNVFDLRNDSLKIIAEIKNKYNTTKGNHKVAIYDDLSGQLKDNYGGYVAYYVEIIPKNKAVYNKPFVPSDNRTHKKRKSREDIRVIDGKSFYDLATGDSEAIKKLYEVLPIVISSILEKKDAKIYQQKKSKDILNSSSIVRDSLNGQMMRNKIEIEGDVAYGRLFGEAY